MTNINWQFCGHEQDDCHAAELEVEEEEGDHQEQVEVVEGDHQGVEGEGEGKGDHLGVEVEEGEGDHQVVVVEGGHQGVEEVVEGDHHGVEEEDGVYALGGHVVVHDSFDVFLKQERTFT